MKDEAAPGRRCPCQKPETSAVPLSTTRRRFVFLGGYYPQAATEIHHRFQRGLGHFARTWGLTATASGYDAPATRWQVDAAGAGWCQQTEVLLFDWEDLILADRARGWPERLASGLTTFADIVLSGTAFRYARASWRYLLFFLYPFVLLFALLAAGWLAAGIIPIGPSTRIVLGLALGAGFVVALDRMLHIGHLIDDWIYARTLMRGTDANADARLAALATTLGAGEGEIVIFGHSLGAVHGAVLIDAMIAADPGGPPIRFATAGSSILKIGLHPAATRLRAVIGRIAQSPRVLWVDFQAHNDAMNFYKAEPVASLGLTGRPADIRPVRFSAMLSPERYRRIRRNFFRLHSQFISANDRRGRYDFFMLACGPFRLEQLAASQSGAMDWIDADGGLTPAGAAQHETKGPRTP